MSSSLEIQNLSVRYGGFYALRDFSLSLKAGDVCAFVGPNGAGKTTTFNSVAGLIPFVHGKVLIDGKEFESSDPEFKRKIGYMPDFFPVYDKLKVSEFIEHFALAFEVNRPGERVAEMLKMVELSGKAEAMCGELSRGMKQRLMFAKTLVHDPDVIFLDEPASGLDPKARRTLRDIILSLKSRGKIIVVSSHILTELKDFCNHIVILEKGHLVQAGPIDSIAKQRQMVTVLVKWRGPVESANRCISDLDVAELKVEVNGAKFKCAPDKCKMVLASLVNQDLDITQWQVLADDLEEIYLESGAREVT